jgi:hypothetical protein
MRNGFDSSAAAAMMVLIDTLVEIGTIAKEADKHVTRETEYSGAITPQALACIELRAIEAIKKVGSMIEDDIRAIDEAEIPKLSDAETPPDFLETLGIYPTTTGRITLYVESGRITANAPVPEEFRRIYSSGGPCRLPRRTLESNRIIGA